MKKKRIIILVLQVLLIIGFGLSFYNYVQGEIEPTEVYVFNGDIKELNTEITAKNVSKITIPAKAITKDMATNKEDVIGKYLVTKAFKGQYVNKQQLVEKDKIDIFDSLDLSKYRKISIPANYIDTLAGNIKRGDRVDLLFTGEGSILNNMGGEEKYGYGKTFKQGLLVHSVNTKDGFKFVDHSDFVLGKAGDENAQGIDVEASSDEIAVITLAVSLEDAEEISVRMKNGNVKVLGRFEDSESYESLGFVLGEYRKKFSGYADAETGRTPLTEDTFKKAN